MNDRLFRLKDEVLDYAAKVHEGRFVRYAARTERHGVIRTGMDQDEDKVILLEPAAQVLRDEFVGWQCRIRQLAVREMGGRPSSGMRPRVSTTDGREIAAALTVLIVPEEPWESAQLFRHQFQKTQDPVERYDKALEITAASYFQRPRDFSDRLTALFGPDSGVADTLLRLGRCTLDFAQFSQSYRLPCSVIQLNESDGFYQATYWHNSMYNPYLPAGVRVLAFTPDWYRAGAQAGG